MSNEVNYNQNIKNEWIFSIPAVVDINGLLTSESQETIIM